MKIVEEKNSILARCVHCGDVNDHQEVRGIDVKITLGSLDFMGISCKNCHMVTVVYPVPAPPGCTREIALEVVEEIQRKVNDAYC